MICITIDKLAEKARNNDWQITNDEAIDTFILIPEGVVRESGIEGNKLFDRLIVKGLGAFEIKNDTK